LKNLKKEIKPYPENISREDVNKLPLRSYSGSTTVISKSAGLTLAFEEINLYHEVGFDTETRPAFVKGKSYNVSLLQIAIPGKVFLIRLNNTGMVSSIIHFLESGIKKVGVGLRDDINALLKIKEFNPGNFCDLNQVASEIGLEAQGLRKLTAIVKKFRISKRQQTSNWEKIKLGESQIRYAATDAWCCLEIFTELRKRGVI